MKGAIAMLGLAVLATVAAWTVSSGAGQSPERPFPPPPPQATSVSGREVAVLAGGCFWGMEGVFEHVKGVRSVTAGYAGGTAITANYEAVSSERTNHAEAIRIVYDPSVIRYGQLLEIYFAVAHDPTQLNAQYPDEGRSYRSAIFPLTPAQQQIAGTYIAALNRAHAFPRPIATRIEVGKFYPAEAYHQQFMRRNPQHPYIRRWDIARVNRLRSRFPEFYRAG
ncbi:MAG: hypothetical protein RLZZ427_1589 [Pseudomonadota bacterium]